MKHFVIFSVIILLSACSSDGKKVEPATQKEEVLLEFKDGVYTEWYPGKKQVKYKGGKDEKNFRNGIWTYFSEEGTELSITIYEHGKREGFTVVKYPNGAIHYRGEYQNDVTVGVWTTYDEKGKFVSETNFPYPEK